MSDSSNTTKESSRAENIADRLLHHLQQKLASVKYVLVGFSGGLDSAVLLHALHLNSRQNGHLSVRAIHIHHGLLSDADAWERHCADFCRLRDIPFCSHQVNVVTTGKGLEAAARSARYDAFMAELKTGETLVLGHHADDQAETILYRLVQGHGVDGLAGIPEQRPIGVGSLIRPMLAFTRTELEKVACHWGVKWIEDASNDDRGYARNYLRHEVMTAICARWPGAAARMARAAHFCQETRTLMEEVAQQDLVACTLYSEAGAQQELLSEEGIQRLSEVRRKNLLRFWLQKSDIQLSEAMWQRVFSLVRSGRRHRELALGKRFSLRVSQGRVHLESEGSVSAANLSEERGVSTPIMVTDWMLSEPLELPGGTLIAEPCKETQGPNCLRKPQSSERVTVRRRVGGERWRPQGRGGSCTLKQSLQEAGVPPWLREHVPLIFYDEVLVAVVGVGIAEEGGAKDGGYQLKLESR